jgi:phytoene dehydrogenase-like protein
MAEYVERYLDDERLQMAYLGQGVIGTNASPRDPGTAYIYFHHFSGRMAGPPGSWGYVKGGMGMVSFILCDVARESGAEVAAGVSVAGVIPGEGVVLEGGERLQAPVVVSNADPRVLLRLLDGAADPDWRRRVESVPMTGVTLKVNCAMAELPDFASRPGTRQPHHLGMINTPLTTAEWQAGFETMRAGRLPAKLWTELYFQSAFEPEAAPPGKHTMSVFAQYVPYRFAEGEGDWESRREEIGNLAIDAIARFCTNLPDAVENMEVLGPPDIERRVGLTGGHIFQGECLPEYMWGRRLSYQTPMRGIYLCGAATHPGGSVIAINGRNAAMEILAVS